MNATVEPESHLSYFAARQKFPLDEFQIRGCQAVESGRGVLVCAPTGAGKTIVGEFAVSLAISQQTKCFYTTPIKALSNQKFHDLVKAHGEDKVGLLTGDVSINRDADIVVMTAEVLRNMIYADSEALDRLSHVVMDEIHFLSDSSRGPVWEEAILGLDASVNVIGLSATVSNSEEFGRWLNTVRGDTEIIVSENRPVPLNQWMLVARRMHPLFEPGTTGEVNSRLVEHIERLEGTTTDGTEYGRAQLKAGGFRNRSRAMGSDNRASRRSPHRLSDKHRALSRPDVLHILQEQDMLPAITFIFSRAGCDAALHQCMRSSLVLTTQEESEEISDIITAGVAGIPEEDLRLLEYRRWRQALMRGFAAHHAGMLPAFRHVVEKLFTKGLVRAVFATETLALGINMPARTVVLEKLVKFNGEGHADLTPGQYTQLTGRAGRRGIDVIGNAVVQWTPAMDPGQVAGLASTRTYPLVSTFAPGYNMSVNLLKTIGFEPAHRLLEKSFAQFQADGSVVDDIKAIESLEESVDQLTKQLHAAFDSHDQGGAGDVDSFLEYIRIRRELTEEERKHKRLSIEQRDMETTRVLSKLQLGDVIAMPGKKHPLLAVVVNPANNKKDPRVWITMETGWSGRVGTDAFAMPPVAIGHMRLSRQTIAQPRKNSRFVVDQFRKANFQRPRRLKTSPRNRPNATISALREQLRSHPAHHWRKREDLARVGEQLVREQRMLEAAQRKVNEATDTLGRTFDRIINLLAEYDYVEFHDGVPVITEEGENLCQIHNESDLLVAQCLKRGIWDDLDPAELAGVVSMCTFENRRETRGEPDAATEEMAKAMNNTVRIWEELSSDERRYRLPITRYPEGGFALAMHQWAAGAPLGYCIAAASESGAELTPGDFVRQCRQVVHLLEQVRSTAYNNDTRRAARKAIDAIRRGVVAIGN